MNTGTWHVRYGERPWVVEEYTVHHFKFCLELRVERLRQVWIIVSVLSISIMSVISKNEAWKMQPKCRNKLWGKIGNQGSTPVWPTCLQWCCRSYALALERIAHFPWWTGQHLLRHFAVIFAGIHSSSWSCRQSNCWLWWVVPDPKPTSHQQYKMTIWLTDWLTDPTWLKKQRVSPQTKSTLKKGKKKQT